tara:strand:- start:360 stop:1709 length:1350 start_codon:yes stop_codon:yes gene_type:complete
MEKFAKYSLIYLLLILAFSWGTAVGKYEIFPYKLIRSVSKEIIKLYKNDDQIVEITISERIKNDLGLFPNKHIVEFHSDIKNSKEIDLKFDSRRSSKPIIKNFMDENDLLNLGKGYLLVQGFMDFKNSLYGSILINLEGRIINQWEYNSHELSDKKNSLKKNHNVHPVVILKDGSLVYTINAPDFGIRIIRQSYCGNIIWSKPGKYHHSISLDENQNLWTSNAEESFVLLDKNNGNIIKEIFLEDVFKKNRNLGLFNFHIDLPTNKSTAGDPFHLNDVEPLNISTKNFDKGDLLISFRNSNLIFILDQDTSKIKWWTVGNTIRQHDPDWQNDYITVFDNSMRNNEIESEKKYMSRILKIDPQNNKAEVLYNGIKHNAYSVMKGNHQIIENGFILATISTQGRLLIIDKDNKLKVELINKYNKTFNGLISESIWVKKDYLNFNIEKFKCD